LLQCDEGRVMPRDRPGRAGDAAARRRPARPFWSRSPTRSWARRPAWRVASLLLLSAAFSAAGCAVERRLLAAEQEPSAEVRGITAGRFEAQRLDLTVSVVLSNPGEELRVTRAEYRLLLDGRPFAVGAARIELVLPRGSEATLSLPMSLTFPEVPARVRQKLERSQPVALALRGRLAAVRTRDESAVRSMEIDGAMVITEWHGASH
jgi:hypothetical protein